jgi:hypothetical protein
MAFALTELYYIFIYISNFIYGTGNQHISNKNSYLYCKCNIEKLINNLKQYETSFVSDF